MEFIVQGASPLCGVWIRGDDLPERVKDQITDPAARAAAATVASEILFNLTGRVWRGCCCSTTVELRPYAGACFAGVSALAATASAGLLNTSTNAVYGEAPERLRLPDWPVTEVVSVEVDGEAVEPAGYRLLNGRELERLTGHWPDVTTVTYLFGQNPPPAALRAASILAGELALASSGLSCRLPKRVSQLQRQGVSVTVLDSMDLFDAGRTGIPEVDAFLGSVNPSRQSGRSRVWSPDIDPQVDRVDVAGLADLGDRVTMSFTASARFDPSFTYRNPDGTPIVTTGYHARWQLADLEGTLIETRTSNTPGSGLELVSPGVFSLVVLGDVTEDWPKLAEWEMELINDSNPLDRSPLAGGRLVRMEQGVAP